MEERLEMQNRVEKSTKMYTKIHGLIQCNRGEQERQVKMLLEEHGYHVEDVSTKKSRAAWMYLKKEVL